MSFFILPHSAVGLLLMFSHKKTWKKICRPENVARLKHLYEGDDRDMMNFRIWRRKTERAVTRQHTSRPLYHDMPTVQETRDRWRDNSRVVY